MSKRNEDALKELISDGAKSLGNMFKDLFSGETTLDEAIDSLPIQRLKSESETPKEDPNVKSSQDTTTEVKKTLFDRDWETSP